MTSIEYFWMWAIKELLRKDDPFLPIITRQLEAAYGDKVSPNDDIDRLLNQQLKAPWPLVEFVRERNDWSDVWLPVLKKGAQIQFTFQDVPIDNIRGQRIPDPVVVEQPQKNPIDADTIAAQVAETLREPLLAAIQDQQEPYPVDSTRLVDPVPDADAIANHVATKLQGPLLEILQRTSMNHENTQVANNNLNANLLAILYANQSHKSTICSDTKRAQKRRFIHDDDTSSEEDE